MEQLKKRGRPRKDRGGILSADQVENLQTDQQILAAQEEKIRQGNLERKRRQRAKEAAARSQAKDAALAMSEEAWHASQRALLTADQLTAMQTHDAYLCDVLFSMRTVQNVCELDPELIEIVVELVKAHGTCHSGRITADQSISVSWSSRPYWQDPELLQKLCSESEATKTLCLYGYLAALPDFRVVSFLTEKAQWSFDRAAALVGWCLDSRDGSVSYNATWAPAPPVPISKATPVATPDPEDTATIPYACPDCGEKVQITPKALRTFQCQRCLGVQQAKTEQMVGAMWERHL